MTQLHLLLEAQHIFPSGPGTRHLTHLHLVLIVFLNTLTTCVWIQWTTARLGDMRCSCPHSPQASTLDADCELLWPFNYSRRTCAYMKFYYVLAWNIALIYHLDIGLLYVDIKWHLECRYEPQWLFSSSIRAEVTIDMTYHKMFLQLWSHMKSLHSSYIQIDNLCKHDLTWPSLHFRESEQSEGLGYLVIQ